MWHGWFNWSWLHWLSAITGSDGEGSYRMIEYQFFLALFVVAALTWVWASRTDAGRATGEAA